MKLHVISDLHQETVPYEPARDIDADVIILPGDLHHGHKALDWIKVTYPDKPVLFVLGNHDYGESDFANLIGEFRDATRGSNIHILENDAVEIGGATFLGCSLWTDFALEGDPAQGAERAGRIMPDYDGSVRVGDRALTPADTLKRHRESVAWLRGQFEQRQREAANNKLVVVTHHAPSAKAVQPRKEKLEYNVALASNLDALVAESRADLWIHGHVHYRLDYQIGQTPVLCNPRGDVARRAVDGFDPRLVVEV